MLRVKENISRTYEERMNDNLTAIPLISSEWTNFNPSDPGITILENLTAFEALQGSYISNPNYRAKLKLLALAGFKPVKGKCARLLLSAEGLNRTVEIEAGQRFQIGELTFETNRRTRIGDCHLTGVFSRYDDKLHDISYLSDREYTAGINIFGKNPREGDSVLFFCDGLPDSDRETSFYFTADPQLNRNPVEDRTENLFASLKWECYTDKGFEEIKFRDYTGAFLTGGEVKLRIPGEKAVIYEEEGIKGYCLKVTLTHALYDVPPRIVSVHAFLFEVWQRKTRAAVLTYGKNRNFKIKSSIEDEGYVLVFGREEKGASYRRYELTVENDIKGRYCRFEREEDGTFRILFDKERFGYEPIRERDAIHIVIYSEEIMRQYRVGTVFGYDDEEIELPLKHVVPETFCLLAKRKDKDGEWYDFVRPEKTGEGALCYHLLENEGKILIEDAGDFIGAELFMAGISVTEGPKGNIRAGSILDAPGAAEGVHFYNPGEGTGGAFRETLDDVKERFRTDVYTPYTCVTAGDYEKCVLTTPGLCIKKAKAVMDLRENSVHIAVMPDLFKEHPKLPPGYVKMIEQRLEERRLITTHCRILQPVYAGVAVRSTVYVKSHFGDCRETITQRFKQALDYENSEKNFGDPLLFEEVFHIIEDLDCVDYVYELSMRPENIKLAALRESDIYPAENCLLHMGELDLEIITNGG